ncbi:hypothetical protein HKX48_007265 [Thoreauomyces humboldtii]|nr:hypothetical protein HKX48_007265 [Thoreauomyces humboldtii]
MLRSLPGVRAVQFHIDKENATSTTASVATPNPAHRTPGPGKLLSARTPGLGARKVFAERENTPKVVGDAAGFKTPGLKAPVGTALKGKSTNVRTSKSSVGPKVPAKSAQRQQQPTTPVERKKSHLPETMTRRPVLGQKHANTLHATPHPADKAKSTTFFTPQKGSAFETPYSSYSSQLALDSSTKPRSSDLPRSRKSSATKGSSGRARLSARTDVRVTAIPEGAGEKGEDDGDIEYMAPSTFETKYIPDEDLIVDHEFLCQPREIPKYVDPVIRALMEDDSITPFDFTGILDDSGLRREFDKLMADDLIVRPLDDDPIMPFEDLGEYVYRPQVPT